MKIIYGVAGEGRGHASRSTALWPFLSEKLDLTIWCPDSISSFIREKCSDVKLDSLPGIHFEFNGHQINYLGSIHKNLPLLFKFNMITDQLAVKMKQQGAQGVISDFEPFTAVAAWKAGIPLLNLNHPGVVRRYISMRPDAVSAQIISSMMTPPAQKNVICSFYDGDVGPILRNEIRYATPRKGKYILVYVKESSVDRVKKILSAFPDQNFLFFPDTKKDFIKSLSGCAAVIAPAGHQLLSESLFLKKPVLAIPQKGQYEQRLNAQMLKASGWGMETDLNNLAKDTEYFIRNIDQFPLKSDPFYDFKFGDYTETTSRIISSFFEEACLKEKLSPRKNCNYFQYIPTKIRQLRKLIA